MTKQDETDEQRLARLRREHRELVAGAQNASRQQAFRANPRKVARSVSATYLGVLEAGALRRVV